MSEKFKIWRERDHDNPAVLGFWRLDYPKGFNDIDAAVLCATFDEIVAEYIAAELRLCPMCGRGAVTHPDWGWQCADCGCHDVAAGHIRPGCTCAMSEASLRNCALHGEMAAPL